MGLKGALDATLDYAEYCIQSELDSIAKKSIKSKVRKQELTEQFFLAYNQLTSLERLENYKRVVNFIIAIKSDKFQHERKFGDLSTDDAYTRSYSLKAWRKKTLRIDRELNHVFCSKDGRTKNYDLNNYILRESKNKQYHCLVLEAINDKPTIKMRTVRIGFKDITLYNEWLATVKQGLIECERTRILKQLGINPYEFLNIDNRS